MDPTRSFRFGDFELDVAQRRLLRAGEETVLQPRVFATLLYLLERSRRVVPKDELLEAIWPDTFVTENALSRCIRQIRRALNDDARSPVFLRTIPRVGYQFVADLEAFAEDGEEAGERSLAVLPFRSLTGTVDEGLELGMADTLITRLSRAHSLLVRPLSATRPGDGRAAGELGSAGGVRLEPDRARPRWHYGQLPRWADPEPLRPFAHSGRLKRRDRSRGGGRLRAPRHW